MEAYFWDLTSDRDASYPIISVSDAWKQILAGKGIISNATPRNANPFVAFTPPSLERILVNTFIWLIIKRANFKNICSPSMFLREIT